MRHSNPYSHHPKPWSKWRVLFWLFMLFLLLSWLGIDVLSPWLAALLALPLGMPVKVQVQLKAQVSGLPVPMTALSRSQANEVMVWVKLSPERFAPRAVQTMPFDGLRVIVTQGLAAGDRVVVQGANLISQIR